VSRGLSTPTMTDVRTRGGRYVDHATPQYQRPGCGRVSDGNALT
jgi:hypothetical protein